MLERLVASLVSISDIRDINRLIRTIAPELQKDQPIHGNGVLQQKEVELLQDAMLRFKGNKSKVAEYLGMSQTTLWRRLKTIENYQGEIM